MKTMWLVLSVLAITIFGGCVKDKITPPPTHVPPTDSSTSRSDSAGTGSAYTAANTTMAVTDLVLYTGDSAYRDTAMLRSFVTRNFPQNVSEFDLGRSSVAYNNSAESLVLLDSGRVKLNGTIMQIVNKTDTQMLVSPLDSTDMPDPSAENLGRCILLNAEVPLYNPYSICNAAGGSCTKYRMTYPIIISGKNYYFPILKYAVVSTCSEVVDDAAPMPNYFNTNLRATLQAKDSILVEVCRLPLNN